MEKIIAAYPDAADKTPGVSTCALRLRDFFFVFFFLVVFLSFCLFCFNRSLPTHVYCYD